MYLSGRDKISLAFEMKEKSLLFFFIATRSDEKLTESLWIKQEHMRASSRPRGESSSTAQGVNYTSAANLASFPPLFSQQFD